VSAHIYFSADSLIGAADGCGNRRLLDKGNRRQGGESSRVGARFSLYTGCASRIQWPGLHRQPHRNPGSMQATWRFLFDRGCIENGLRYTFGRTVTVVPSTGAPTVLSRSLPGAPSGCFFPSPALGPSLTPRLSLPPRLRLGLLTQRVEEDAVGIVQVVNENSISCVGSESD